MRRAKKCRCGAPLCPPGGRSSHFWHLPGGVVELCAACSDRRVAQCGEMRVPDVRLDFYLVGHGYQLDVYHDLRKRGRQALDRMATECRDFSSSHRIATLRDALTLALLEQVDRWRDDPVQPAARAARRASRRRRVPDRPVLLK